MEHRDSSDSFNLHERAPLNTKCADNDDAAVGAKVELVTAYTFVLFFSMIAESSFVQPVLSRKRAAGRGAYTAALLS